MKNMYNANTNVIIKVTTISCVLISPVLKFVKNVVVEEAEKVKSVISDESLNRLARYLHKELGLSNLNCNYDINESKCRECIKRNNSKK